MAAKVAYRVEPDGEVLAVFSGQVENWRGDLLCYAFIGQHSTVSSEYYCTTRPATESEAAELHNHLLSIYGELDVVKRVRWTEV